MFTTDHDLLRWEPNVGRDALALAVTRLDTDATLDGRDLIVPSGGLYKRVAPGELVLLEGDAIACLPVVSIESDTRCVVNRESAWPSEPGIHRPTHDRIDRVRARFITFEPLRRIAEAALPGLPVGEFSRTRVASLAALHLIYAALNASREHDAGLTIRRELYLALHRQALRSQTPVLTRKECA
jgi:hypothetical protein